MDPISNNRFAVQPAADIIPSYDLYPGGNDAYTESTVWRSERVCGVNCVFLLAQYWGKEVQYSVLQKLLIDPDSNSLNSLSDLVEAADDCGLNLRAAQFKRDDLRKAAKPLIAHFDIVQVSGKTNGHFVVVVKANDEGVVYLDGTTAETRTVSWREFLRDWSGYVACVSPRNSLWDPTAAIALLGGVFLGLLVEVGIVRYRNRKSCRNNIHP